MTILASLSDPLVLLLLSVLAAVAGGCGSLLLRRAEGAATWVAAIAGVVAAAVSLYAGLSAILEPARSLDIGSPFPFAHCILRLDPLAALMIAVISLLALVAWIYSLSYVREYEDRGIGAIGFFMHFFIASMLLVVVADNALWFLIFFEMMSLASYFLVLCNQDEESVSAGFLYFVVAHGGSALVMAAFFLMANHSGSLDFASFRASPVPAPLNSVVFVLGFLGFGAKAGMIPLHIWLPRAHPAASSHASALMSGVMIKIGIFGIVKIAVDLLGGAGALWWGLLVLGFGAVSSVLGVVYALAEHDIKRLLAYHSVENIGIIMLGVGVGMIGLATQQPVVAVLGLMAGLYHLINHAMFKGLLFLGAGSVVYRTHTKDMEKMGGLSQRMPATALCFLTGSLAISAIPPLNGFVSEWYTYQSLFAAALHGTPLVRFATPIAAMLLALTGALAVMCFVKAYGVIFSGETRHPHANDIREVPPPMVAGMAVLAIACVALGLGGPIIAPALGKVAAVTLGTGLIPLADGAVMLPATAQQAVLSTPLIAILLVGAGTVPLILKMSLSGGRRAKTRRSLAPWAAGYLPDHHMPATAGGFAQPVRMFFAPLYDVRTILDRVWSRLEFAFGRLVTGARRVEPSCDRLIVDPLTRGVMTWGGRLRIIQGGDFRVYCLYIVAILIILLALSVR